LVPCGPIGPPAPVNSGVRLQMKPPSYNLIERINKWNFLISIRI